MPAMPVRGFARQPAFTLITVLTLAFTIGAVSTVFTLVNTLLFLQLPVDRPGELVEVGVTRNQGRDPGFISPPRL